MTEATTKPKPKAPAPKPEAPVTGLTVETLLTVEDNTSEPDVQDERLVTATERELTSGLTVVDYV